MAIMKFSMIMKTRKLKTSAKMHSAGSLVHHCDGTSPLVGNEPPVIISHISWVLEVSVNVSVYAIMRVWFCA